VAGSETLCQALALEVGEPPLPFDGQVPAQKFGQRRIVPVVPRLDDVGMERLGCRSHRLGGEDRVVAGGLLGHQLDLLGPPAPPPHAPLLAVHLEQPHAAGIEQRQEDDENDQPPIGLPASSGAPAPVAPATPAPAASTSEAAGASPRRRPGQRGGRSPDRGGQRQRQQRVDGAVPDTHSTSLAPIRRSAKRLTSTGPPDRRRGLPSLQKANEEKERE
jgi:hypothetical protein